MEDNNNLNENKNDSNIEGPQGDQPGAGDNIPEDTRANYESLIAQQTSMIETMQQQNELLSQHVESLNSQISKLLRNGVAIGDGKSEPPATSTMPEIFDTGKAYKDFCNLGAEVGKR